MFLSNTVCVCRTRTEFGNDWSWQKSGKGTVGKGGGWSAGTFSLSLKGTSKWGDTTFPWALAVFLLHQLAKLRLFYSHRRRVQTKFDLFSKTSLRVSCTWSILVHTVVHPVEASFDTILPLFPTDLASRMLTNHLDWASNATRDSWQVTTAPSKCHWQHVLEIYHVENSSGEWSSFNAAEEGSSDREQFYVLYLLLSCCLCLAKYRKVVGVVLLMFWGRGRSFLRILEILYSKHSLK